MTRLERYDRTSMTINYSNYRCHVAILGSYFRRFNTLRLLATCPYSLIMRRNECPFSLPGDSEACHLLNSLLTA